MNPEDIENVVVDSSFVISLMDKHDINHKKVKKYFMNNKFKYHSPEFLIAELSSFFERKYGENSSDSVVDKIKIFIEFHQNYSKIEKLITMIKKYKTRGADSIFVRLADKMNCALITCDIDQGKKYTKGILI